VSEAARPQSCSSFVYKHCECEGVSFRRSNWKGGKHVVRGMVCCLR
jgi:hypothetical protein